MTSFQVVHVVLTRNFAGVERHVSVLAGEQARCGIGVTVVGGDDVQMRMNLPAEVTTIPLPGKVDLLPALRSVAADAQIVHAHMTAAEMAALWSTALRRVPVVTTRHFSSPRARRAGLPVRNLIGSRMRLQIAVSKYVADGIDGPSEIVYSGVPDQGYRGAELRGRSILMAQRLEREKETETGIRAFVESGLGQQGWRLLIAGLGSERERLERLVRGLRSEHVIEFMGFRPDVASLMRESSIFFAPAPSEPFGLSVVEAMASGTPVVAARGGGHLESVGRATDQTLFTPGDVAAAAAVVRRLAERPSLRDDVGSASRTVQQELFTPQRQEEETRRLYEQVLA